MYSDTISMGVSWWVSAGIPALFRFGAFMMDRGKELVTARYPFTKRPNSRVTKNFPLPQIEIYNSTKVTLVRFGNLNP